MAVEGEGAGELPADATNLAVRAYALLADPAGQALRASRTGSRSSAGSARRRRRSRWGSPPRVRTATPEELLAAGLRAREPRRQPRGRAGRRRDAHVGRSNRPDRRRRCRSSRWRSSRGSGRRPRRRARSLPALCPARRRCRERRARGAARRRRAPPTTPTLFAAGLDDRLHEPYRALARPSRRSATIRRRRARRDALRIGPHGHRVGRRCDGAVPRRSRGRFPDHSVVPLGVSPKGAL